MALKLVTVTQTTTLRVDIPDELLTPEAIEEFEATRFNIKADPDNLFGYVSTLYVKHFRTIGGLAPWVRTSVSMSLTNTMTFLSKR